jgi:hypothetical protein
MPSQANSLESTGKSQDLITETRASLPRRASMAATSMHSVAIKTKESKSLSSSKSNCGLM